ncbi:DUF3568 family protein [Sedimenticola sp.]|uniref:DUF3568 family protein n=1 Tax=Sedimenticola sp. TaxID=1940285 RepID=UPI003D140EB5
MYLLKRITKPAIVLVCAFGINGCDPITLTAASIGAGVGVNHTLGGMIYKTFTAPMKSVETAAVRAMKDMGIKVDSRSTNEKGERIILASANKRDIEVRLEPLTKRTTQMRAVASEGVLKDSATATEIVLQTERVLSGG